MNAKDRRQRIGDWLQNADGPISATSLANRLSVSRQVIVGDVALLRAKGLQITATPRGYVILPVSSDFIGQVAVQHDASGIEAELNAIVDNGCTAVDVIVEHPIYGQLTGSLQISSRYDVRQFLDRSARYDAQPLSRLTAGIHLHTVSCPDQDAFQRVCLALEALKILLPSEG